MSAPVLQGAVAGSRPSESDQGSSLQMIDEGSPVSAEVGGFGSGIAVNLRCGVCEQAIDGQRMHQGAHVPPGWALLFAESDAGQYELRMAQSDVSKVDSTERTWFHVEDAQCHPRRDTVPICLNPGCEHIAVWQATGAYLDGIRVLDNVPDASQVSGSKVRPPDSVARKWTRPDTLAVDCGAGPLEGVWAIGRHAENVFVVKDRLRGSDTDVEVRGDACSGHAADEGPPCAHVRLVEAMGCLPPVVRA